MTYLNERWFTTNDTLAEARGHSLGARIRARHGGPASRPNGGIHHPARTVLAVQTALVRFDGSSRPAVARNGKWWLTMPQFKLVKAFAAQERTTIADAVAALCYVPEEWNNMQVMIQAVLKQPLLAYTGVGRAAHGEARHYPVRADATGHQIIQAFIPGLHDTNVHDAIAITAAQFQPGR